jgi:ABC-type multidrug transport system fused ATPase/permease subunit
MAPIMAQIDRPTEMTRVSGAPLAEGAAGSPAESCRGIRAKALASDMLRVLLSNRFWLVGLLIALAGQAALQPSSAWITKTALNAVQAETSTVESLLFQFGPLAIVVALGMTVLRFAEKIFNKIVESRLIVNLQRVYLARRREESDARDVSQVLFGCEVAKKGFEVVYKESWRITAEIISVVAWQISLGPEWIPLMLIAVLPSMALVWVFGPYVQRASLEILSLQRHIAGTTKRLHHAQLVEHQERLWRKIVHLEALRWGADEAMDVVMWAILIALMALAHVYRLDILPRQIELGGLGAFLINVTLLAKPLGDIGKIYVKWREAYPALTAVFQPDPATTPDRSSDTTDTR